MSDRYSKALKTVMAERDALRRQVEELRRALETIRMLSQPEISDEEWEKIESLLPDYFEAIDILMAIHKQARAALARVGGGGGEEE